jgi:hypothetical protein
MKDFLSRLLLAIAVTLAAFFFASLAHAQQGDEDPAPATPQQHQPQANPTSSAPQQAAKPYGQKSPDQKKESSNASDQTQDALSFTGRVGREKGDFVLYDPVTKMTYQLDDPAKAKEYLGKQVKIVGKLAMRSNTIHIDSIDVVH